jgi:tRNA threonylcarbamoyl adenosine modification protein (Sua5/YciO/YrdC/YwlC family)
MSQYFQVHPVNPQLRLLRRAIEILQDGGVIAYPTDSAYALGCAIGNKAALNRIRSIRRLDDGHNFTLVCRDLSELSIYAKVDNRQFRLLRNLTPGPYTFILAATAEVPRRLMHPRRRTIGLRVPDNRIAQDLLAALDEPLMSVTLILPGDDYPMVDPQDIRERLEKQIDLVIDGGSCGLEPTSVIDLAGEVPRVIRAGKGDVSMLEA